MIWPMAIAPYHATVLTLGKEPELARAAEDACAALAAAGLDVLYDDRDERPGVKFKDADLIGFPVRIVIGSKALAKGVVEVSTRREKKAEGVAPEKVVEVVKATLAAGAKTLAL
jgi:prolyl-tRNA synthetase